MSARRNLLPHAALALLSLAATAPGFAADDIGRLFFTPVQRQELDRRRQTDSQESQVTSESFLTVNGRVSRSGGKSTTWVNGVAQHDLRGGKDPVRATVSPGEDQPSVSLKIGETLDKVRNEVRDGLQGGEVRVPSDKR